MIICDQPEGLELGCAPTVANRSPETRVSAPDARGLVFVPMRNLLNQFDFRLHARLSLAQETSSLRVRDVLCIVK